MDVVIETFFNIDVIRESVPFLVQGLWMTLKLCVVVVPLGIAGGLLVATLNTLPYRWLRVALIAYVDFFRAFPPLVLLVFVYYGLPFLGLELSDIAAVALAFLLNTSSFYGKIFRAGIESIGRGQWEAARSSGLSGFQTMRFIILPQAVRNVLPDLLSNTLEVIKLTSLASVVALPELLRMARVAQGLTYNPTPLVLAALIYLVLLAPAVRLEPREHLEDCHLAPLGTASHPKPAVVELGGDLGHALVGGDVSQHQAERFPLFRVGLEMLAVVRDSHSIGDGLPVFLVSGR